MSIVAVGEATTAEQKSVKNSTSSWLRPRAALCLPRFIDLFGPLGAGVRRCPISVWSQASGSIDLRRAETRRSRHRRALSRRCPHLQGLPAPLARHPSRAHDHNLPLDLVGAAVAAAFCAQKEDELIFFATRGSASRGLADRRRRLVAPRRMTSRRRARLRVAATDAHTGGLLRALCPSDLATPVRLVARVHERTAFWSRDPCAPSSAPACISQPPRATWPSSSRSAPRKPRPAIASTDGRAPRPDTQPPVPRSRWSCRASSGPMPSAASAGA